ncbi:MAG: bi-domain-containing oxidoreductase [Nitrospirae bacterium]|nr:bi-domain-containing oxidoreductase [Nitrospirota bacterium]
MKQVIQNYRTGQLSLDDVPAPICGRDTVLVRNVASLISVGTESSIIELGAKSLLGKARARPDLVKRFSEKAKQNGILKTFKEALNRLDTPTPLGYSSAGIVVEVGANVHKFSPGDRVACVGAGYASHAEYISVPEMLCAHMPQRLADGNHISFEEASFGTLGIIALHGIRSAKLSQGENVAVVGLGLLGLLTVQILVAYGFTVIGMDLVAAKAEMARKFGVHMAFATPEEFTNGVNRLTEGYGADAVIVTAAAKGKEPIDLAVDASRFGGRVVVVGVVDIHPHRNDLWHKEVEIVVSKGGGAGTLDVYYENRGIDYPVGYVRWTEGRNLDEFLRLIGNGLVNVATLITHRFSIENAEDAYRAIMDGTIGNFIAVVLGYEDKGEIKRVLRLNNPVSKKKDQLTAAVVGAGLFGGSVLLPTLQTVEGVHLKKISTSKGANAFHAGTKFGFEEATTDYKELINDNDIDAVFVVTPHSMHARQVCEFLEAGKHVFVEKPLCVNKEELQKIISIYDRVRSTGVVLMVGYNRRFSPHSVKISEFLRERHDPMVISYVVNAGFVPSSHWVHAEEQGGGRIIGEMCHFVDLMQYLTKSDPARVYAERISSTNTTSINNDNVVVVIKFEDGSVGNIIYSASGDRAYSREQMEIFVEGKVVTNDDFSLTRYYSSGKSNKFKTLSQQIGYKEELRQFVSVASGKVEPLFSAEELFMSTAAVFDIQKSLEEGIAVDIRV